MGRPRDLCGSPVVRHWGGPLPQPPPARGGGFSCGDGAGYAGMRLKPGLGAGTAERCQRVDWRVTRLPRKSMMSRHSSIQAACDAVEDQRETGGVEGQGDEVEVGEKLRGGGV